MKVILMIAKVQIGFSAINTSVQNPLSTASWKWKEVYL